MEEIVVMCMVVLDATRLLPSMMVMILMVMYCSIPHPPCTIVAMQTPEQTALSMQNPSFLMCQQVCIDGSC